MNMDINILSEIFEKLLDAASDEKQTLSRYDFIEYLFHDRIGTHTLDNKDYTLLYNNKKLPVKFLYSLSDCLKEKTDWSPQYLTQKKNFKFNEEKLHENLKGIMKKYFLTERSEETDLSSEEMIKHLVFYQYIDCMKVDIMFPNYTLHENTYYVPWKDKEKQLINLLENNNVVYVTGAPGTGKQRLIKHILRTKKAKGTEIYFFINPHLSIKEQIESIEFSGKPCSIDQALNNLKRKDGNAFLILHLPCIDNDTFRFINSNLTGLEMKFIIITYTKHFPNNTANINLDERPIPHLRKIFDLHCTNVTLDSAEFESLCITTNKNPYAISILASVLKHATNPFLLKEPCLNLDYDFWNTSKLPSFHAMYHDNGDKSKLNPRQLLLRILDYYPNDLLKNSLPELAIWTKHPLQRSLLDKGFDSQLIESALSYNILQDDNGKISMPQIIADTILHHPKYSIAFKYYHTQLRSFIDSIKPGCNTTIAFSDLYPIIRNMVDYFHFKVTTVPNKITTKQRNDLNEWNTLLIELIYYLGKIGNFELSHYLSSYLYINYNKRIGPVPVKSKEAFYIKSLITKQTELYECQPFTNYDSYIHYIDSIISLFKNFQSEMPKNDTLCMQLFHITEHIIFDLLEHRIRVEKNTSLSQIINGCAINLNDNIHFLFALGKISYVLSTEGLNSSYIHYFRAIHAFISASICDPQGYALKSALEHTNHVLKAKNVSSELRFKMRCQRFYYLFLKLLPIPYPTHIPGSFSNFEYYIKEFDVLLNEFQKKIWDWETAWLFYSCTLLAYKFFPDEYTESLSNILKDIIPFTSDQITMPENDKQEIMNLVTDYLKITD